MDKNSRHPLPKALISENSILQISMLHPISFASSLKDVFTKNTMRKERVSIHIPSSMGMWKSK